MELIKISLLIGYLTSFITGVLLHSPEVKEDVIISEKENLRKSHNPDESYVSIGFIPPAFNFQQAKQQDYLKQKYAEQQLINVAKITKLRKNPLNKNIKELVENSDLKHHNNQEIESSDWQPSSTVKRRQERSSGEKKKVEKSQINRQDDTGVDINRHIMYIDPRILKRILELKSKRTDRSFNEQSSTIDENSLNDLIGKNPHIQLQSLKRILQQSHQTQYLPLIGGDHPFHNKDHTPITERTLDIPNPKTRPNIQVSDNPVSEISQNQAVTKETFEQYQKQLDEASKFQVHQALHRAQQAAQAHVAAQHKAIEQAQRAIFENVQKTLLDSPQALRLVQPKFSDFTTHISAPIQHHQIGYPTPLPPQVVSPAHDINIPTSKVQISKYKTVLPTAVPTIFYSTIGPEESSHSNSLSEVSQMHNIHTLKVTPIPTQNSKHFLIQPQIKHVVVTQKPQQELRTKNIEHYAPNHLHQAVAQLQAEKVLLQQVHSHNNAILSNNKESTRYVGQKNPLQSISDQKTFEKEVQPTANTYQHIILQQKQTEDVRKLHPEEEQTEENDELQYAAKYAFGYRIKDNQEGNDFGHEEKRNGRSAEGSYHVLLPDGRMQKVEYYADDNGYHAKVTYENVGHRK